eukprot:PhM_4_TR11626/c3_g1_i1/m.57164
MSYQSAPYMHHHHHHHYGAPQHPHGGSPTTAYSSAPHHHNHHNHHQQHHQHAAHHYHHHAHHHHAQGHGMGDDTPLNRGDLYNTMCAMVTPQLGSILLDEYLKKTPEHVCIPLQQVLSDMCQAADYYVEHLVGVIQSREFVGEVIKYGMKARMEMMCGPVDDAQLAQVMMMRPTLDGLLRMMLDDEDLNRAYQSSRFTSPNHSTSSTPQYGASPYRSARATPYGSANVTPLHNVREPEPPRAPPAMSSSSGNLDREVRTPGSLASVPSWASISSSWADEVEDLDRLGDDDDEDIGMDDMLDLAKQAMEQQQKNAEQQPGTGSFSSAPSASAASSKQHLSEFDSFLQSVNLLHLSSALKEIKITDMPSLRRGVHQPSFRRVVPIAADRERITSAVDAAVPRGPMGGGHGRGMMASNYIHGKGVAPQQQQQRGTAQRPFAARSWDEAKDQNRTLHVRNLDKITEAALRDHFGRFGEVQDIRFMHDAAQNYLGLATVMFATAAQAEAAAHSTPHVIDGTTVSVRLHGPGNSGPRGGAPAVGVGAQGASGECRFYKTPQGCRNGGRCPYAHN